MKVFVNNIFIRLRSIMKSSMRCTYHLEWCSDLTYSGFYCCQIPANEMKFRLFGNVVILNVVGWFMFLNKIYNSHINISVVSTGLQLKCQSPSGCEDQLLILLLANSKFNYFHQVFSQCWLLRAPTRYRVTRAGPWSISIWDQILSCFYSSLAATPPHPPIF